MGFAQCVRAIGFACEWGGGGIVTMCVCAAHTRNAPAGILFCICANGGNRGVWGGRAPPDKWADFDDLEGGGGGGGASLFPPFPLFSCDNKWIGRKFQGNLSLHYAPSSFPCETQCCKGKVEKEKNAHQYVCEREKFQGNANITKFREFPREL